MDNESVYLTLAATAAAIVLNLVLTPILIHLAHRYHWYDEIDHRKIHSGKIPRIGGVGISVSFFVVTAVFVAARGFFPGHLPILSFTRYLPFAAAFLMINLLGLVDDFSNLRARVKILFQAVAAAVVTVVGHPFSGIYIPFAGYTLPFGILSYPLTFLWIIGLCNAVNLLDGLDGLAGGTSAIAALSMGAVFVIQHNYTAALLAFVLGGAIIGFLFFNMPPARLFMGDSGALFIGFVLASLPIMEPAAGGRGTPFLLAATILLIPILDTVAAILRRIRRHTPIHVPDREHIHHKLLDLGVSSRGILAIIYTINLVLGTSIILWALKADDIYFLWVLFAWVVAIGFFLVLDRLNRRRRINEQKEAELGKG
jgi:UDP-GlcNAc:undecaprenyl-phosphate GlcNAc-1-phosphate transferase